MPVRSDIPCPLCGRVQHIDAERELGFADIGLFMCDRGGCGLRAAYGKMMPRVVVEPYTDERGMTWLRRRFQDPKTKEDIYVVDLDPQWAAVEAKNVLSVVLP